MDCGPFRVMMLWSLISIVFLFQHIHHAEAFYMNRVSVEEFRSSPLLNEPVVVENALDYRGCSVWWAHILTRSAEEDIIVDQAGHQSSMKLRVALPLTTLESSHHNPIYMSSEGSSCSTDQLPFYDLLESLFDDQPDWLPLFSLHAPIYDTLVVAGEGATCKLQCHPYTCFSLGLAGNQLWRLLPPFSFPQGESMNLKAWDGYSFSMGQNVKNGDLFAFRNRNVALERTEEELAFMDDERFIEYQDLAEGGKMLRPNLVFDDPWTSTVVLDGDLLVIPPNWWYQSYGLEMSVSLSSQRCHSLSDVLQHIVRDSNLVVSPTLTRILEQKDFTSMDEAREAVDKLFSLLEEQEKQKKSS